MVDNKKPERKQECVQVVVRCRPFSTKEKKENRGNIIQMETGLFQVGVRVRVSYANCAHRDRVILCRRSVGTPVCGHDQSSGLKHTVQGPVALDDSLMILHDSAAYSSF